MEIFAILALAVFLVGYVVLGGMDVGTCMLLPFLARGGRERRLVITAVGPFFLTSEVWLVAAVGLVAGVFPGLESLLLEGLYPLVVSLLLGWVLRDVGLWFRGRADARAWRLLCDGFVVAGAWLLALSLGGILGNAVVGLSGLGFGTLLAIPVAALYASHGAGFAALRLTGEPALRAARVPGRLAVTVPILLAGGLLAVLRLPTSGAVADGGALGLVVTVTWVMVPLLLAAQALVWWIFRGRVIAPSYL